MHSLKLFCNKSYLLMNSIVTLYVVLKYHDVFHHEQAFADDGWRGSRRKQKNFREKAKLETCINMT